MKQEMKQDMNQTTAKDLAKEIVGDGQSPNLWFVTHGPYVMVDTIYGDRDFDRISGFDAIDDTHTFGPFATYQEALDRYNEIDLSFDYGIGQVFIEDRECGTITEKWLYKRVRIEYVQDEHDDSKRFYKTN